MLNGEDTDPRSGENPPKKRCKIFETFSKFWVSVLMICAIVDMNLSYVLAYLGKEQIAETLSIAVVTEIIGVMAIYLIRAFLDSHYEAKDSLNTQKLDVYQQMMASMPSKSSSTDTGTEEEYEPDIDELDSVEEDDEESEG